jgi:cytidylate kinase
MKLPLAPSAPLTLLRAPSGLGDDHHEGGVVIVTISREYGAAGLAVADGTAQALGYRLLTDDLPAAVAARLGTSREAVAARAGAEAPLAERVLGGLEAGSPESIGGPPASAIDPFDEDVRRELERSVREAAAAGDVVILGRMASVVLAGSPGMIRVFLTAPRAWRIERVCETFGFTPQRANAEIDRVDARRRNYARARFGVVWGSPDGYDLVVDTSRFGIEGAVSLIVAAVQHAL